MKISLSIAIQFLWQNVTIRSGMKSQAYDKECYYSTLHSLIPSTIVLRFPYTYLTTVYDVCFLLCNSPASEFYMPTFRNTLSVPSS
jgi:hypothetical protein